MGKAEYEEKYLHQWRHLFRAIASERNLEIRSLGGSRSRRPHRPVMFEFAVDCWRNQHFPRWLRAISFRNLNPALVVCLVSLCPFASRLNLSSSDGFLSFSCC